MSGADALRQAARAAPLAAPARLLRFNLIARAGAHQDLSGLVRAQGDGWRETLAAAQGGKRVLIATNIGGHFGLSAIDRLLALALTLRGARATTVLCDQALSACQMDEMALAPGLAVGGQPRLLCGYCHAPAAAAVRALGLPLATLGRFIDASLRAEARALAAAAEPAMLRQVTWRGLPVGEHALAGALRYVARADLAGEPNGTALARRYLEAAVLAAGGYLEAIEALRPEVLVAHHGIYVPQGLAAAAARARGVRVVTWNPAYRRHCFIFSHDDTYHRTLMDEPGESWRRAPFDAAQRAATLDYLRSRRAGGEDWIRFHADPDDDIARQLAAQGADPDKPMILALTNVFWDAQLHYPANGFAAQRDWLLETVRWFASRPDLQLVVRVHPAELSGSPPSRQRALDEIRAAFAPLPRNVVLIGPDNPLSTYGLAERANAALIYATKMGVELSAVGLPVIVAGEAWVRGKGFTIDVADAEQYRAALARLPFAGKLDEARRELALRYARHFFFRRMLALPFVERDRAGGGFSAHVRGLDELRAGASAGLDIICDGILNGAPFVA